MDLLKDIVANVKKTEAGRKRKLLQANPPVPDAPTAAGDKDDGASKRPRTSKYLSRGEIERLAAIERQREQELRARTPSPADALTAAGGALSSTSSPHRSSSTSPKKSSSRPSSRLAQHGRTGKGGNEDDDDDDEPQLDIPSDEVIRRLRARGQPIRLFGESDAERIVRMRNIEADADDSDKGQRNEYARQLARTEVGLELEMLHKEQAKAAKERKGVVAEVGDKVDVSAGAAAGSGSGDGPTSASSTTARAATSSADGSSVYKPEYDVSELSSKLLATNPDKCFILVYVYLKRMLEDWEQELATRPDHIRRSVQGKHEATKFVQTKDNLKPFFKLLKRKAVDNDVMEKIADILKNVQRREYVRANDHYLQLSIGNAPWPIGVTMVGIHERSAREKISSHQVAHALNDETQRKWIQSVKRIMTFAQHKYPPDDPAKMVG
ncbi:Prp18 domain-domain-containing protein [Catenaria anguillulae PL171]|uniref:Pre-mRNA-splicing factor 18 n=1 Tax=Catenaria anguillulae PL171 TaxID=765915 RepID=A0A1Y2HXQ3_9FUNG|nr:Prp18 domain-domain-containing protein [Catenaria anguillulae PL171]